MCESYFYGNQLAAREAVGPWHLSSCSARLGKHLSRNGQQCYTSVIGEGVEIPLLVPDLIEKRVEQLHVCPDFDLQCLCWDVVKSRSLAISQLRDSI